MLSNFIANPNQNVNPEDTQNDNGIKDENGFTSTYIALTK